MKCSSQSYHDSTSKFPSLWYKQRDLRRRHWIGELMRRATTATKGGEWRKEHAFNSMYTRPQWRLTVLLYRLSVVDSIKFGCSLKVYSFSCEQSNSKRGLCWMLEVIHCFEIEKERKWMSELSDDTTTSWQQQASSQQATSHIIHAAGCLPPINYMPNSVHCAEMVVLAAGRCNRHGSLVLVGVEKMPS